MGRKIHPTAFRLGISKDHKSKWYAPFSSYGTLLKEDYQIRSEIFKNPRSHEISSIEILRSATGKEITINISTSNPGLLDISSGLSKDELVKSLKSFLEDKKQITINILELVSPDSDANLVAKSICSKLRNRASFKKVLEESVLAIKSTESAKGLKIRISGRLNGAEIARSEWVKKGQVPLQTLDANIDYAYHTALTIYGILGVKVWVFRGESSPL